MAELFGWTDGWLAGGRARRSKMKGVRGWFSAPSSDSDLKTLVRRDTSYRTRGWKGGMTMYK